MKRHLIPVACAITTLLFPTFSSAQTAADSFAEFKAKMKSIDEKSEQQKNAHIDTIVRYVEGKETLLKALGELENFSCGVVELTAMTLNTQIEDTQQIMSRVSKIVNCESSDDITCLSQQQAALSMITDLQNKVDLKQRKLSSLRLEQAACKKSEAE